MTPEQEAAEIDLLCRAARETYEKLKQGIIDIGPDHIPPLLVLVLAKLPEGDDQRKYLGVIVDPDQKDQGIRHVLDTCPALQAYVLIMHANTWSLPTTARKEDLPEISVEDLKAMGDRSDSLVLLLVRPDESKMLAMESYTKVGTELHWKDMMHTGTKVGDISQELNPIYQQVFMKEDDFQ